MRLSSAVLTKRTLASGRARALMWVAGVAVFVACIVMIADIGASFARSQCAPAHVQFQPPFGELPGETLRTLPAHAPGGVVERRRSGPRLAGDPSESSAIAEVPTEFVAPPLRVEASRPDAREPSPPQPRSFLPAPRGPPLNSVA